MIGQLYYELPADGGIVKVPFSSSEEWTVVSGEPWVTISPLRGGAGDNIISIAAEANKSFDTSRTADIKIMISDKSQYLTVHQGESKGYIIDQKEYEIGKEGGSIRIPIKSNISDYNCAVDKGCKSWISIVKTKSLDTYYIQLEILENTNGEVREGSITVSYSDYKETIKIIQAAGDELIVTTNTFNLGADGGKINVPVSTNNDIMASIISGHEWITVESVQTKTMQDYYVVLSISPNESYDARIGQIKVQSGTKNDFYFEPDGNMSVITILQGCTGELILSSTSYEIGSNGGRITIPVISNIDYSCEILSGSTWLTVSLDKTKSFETSYVGVSIDKNTTYDARVGQIKFIGAGKESFVTITQSQLDAIVVESTTYEIDENGGIIDIPIESNVEYEARFTKDYGWISFEQVATKGMENKSLTMKVDVNDTYEDRSAEIIISSPDNNNITKQIIITQAQKDGILVPQQEYEVSKEESPLTINIQHNIDITVQISCDWIISVATKALQISDYNFIVKENTTGSERSGEIKFMSSDNSIIQRVVVRQSSSGIYKGNYTISSQEDITFLRDGQYSKIDGNLSIKDIVNVSDLDNLIEEITGDLSIYNISNFDGLYGLRRIGGDLNIAFTSSCTRLLSLEGLNNLEVIGGDFYCHYTFWSSNESNKLSGFAENDFGKLNKLKSIGGDLIVELFPYRPGNLTSLKGLENLSFIGGGIRTEYVSSLDGLSGIKEAKSLYIEDVSNIDGLRNLMRVCGDVSLINGDFESFSGLRNLEFVDGDLLIEAYVNVNGTGTVEKFSNVTSFAGFDALREVTGDFIVYSDVDASYGYGYGLNNLNSFEGLNNLQRIGGNLKIMARGTGDGYTHGDRRYSEAHCLNNLSSINIASLQEIGGDLIVDNWYIGDGDGERYYLMGISDFSFSNLKTIGGDITYHYHLNDGASSYYEQEGYGEIKIAPAKLQSVRNINAICSFDNENDGFSSLETVENLIGNGKGFPNLKQIKGSFTIDGADITVIGSMPYLESIAETLTISNTKVTEITSFNKLSKVGTILVTDNSSLAIIDGFSSLSQCNSIKITNSPVLKDFGSFVNAVRNGSSWYIEGCGYNPTKYQMQNGQSKL